MSIELPDDEVSRAAPANRVTWLELFYDLVFVAAIVAFSGAITHKPSWLQVGWVAIAFAAFWFVWFGTTLGFNLDRRDEAIDRALVVVQMIALTVCAVALGEGPEAFEPIVALTFALAVGTVACLVLRSVAERPDHRRYLRRLASVSGALAAMYVGIAFAPASVAAMLWAAGFFVVVLVVGALVVSGRNDALRLDPHHLSERFGLLTIIVLGESLVKLVLVASEGRLDAVDINVAVVMFVCIFGIFWAYFDDVPAAGISPMRTRQLGLFLGHLTMQAGCIGLAIGLATLARESTTRLGWLSGGFAWASVVLVYLGLALIGPGTRRRPIAPLLGLRVATACLLVAGIPLVMLLPAVSPDDLAFVIAAVTMLHAAAAHRLRRRTIVSASASAAGATAE